MLVQTLRAILIECNYYNMPKQIVKTCYNFYQNQIVHTIINLNQKKWNLLKIFPSLIQALFKNFIYFKAHLFWCLQKETHSEFQRDYQFYDGDCCNMDDYLKIQQSFSCLEISLYHLKIFIEPFYYPLPIQITLQEDQKQKSWQKQHLILRRNDIQKENLSKIKKIFHEQKRTFPNPYKIPLNHFNFQLHLFS